MLSAVSALHEATGVQVLDLEQPADALTQATMYGALIEDKAQIAVAVIAEFTRFIENGLDPGDAAPLLEDIAAELAALLLAVYRTSHVFGIDVDAVLAELEKSMRHAFPG